MRPRGRTESDAIRAPLVVPLVLLAACLLSNPTFAQPDPLQEGLLETSFVGTFDGLWIRYRDAERQGDVETAERTLEEIRRLRVERNVFNLRDIALSFVYKATYHLDQGELDKAREGYEIAAELDPTLPSAYRGLARLVRSSGALGWLTSIGYEIQTLLAALRSVSDGGYALADLALMGSIALSAIVLVFAVLMLYRYAKLIQHDLSERLEHRIGKTGVGAATLAVCLLPLILTLGVGWLVPYWLAVTFAYQSWKERSLTAAGLVLLFMTAPLFELHARWSRTMVNPLYRAAMSTVDGTFDVSGLLELQEASRRIPEDRDLQFLIAIQYKNLGEYELSATRYREILEHSPDDLGARVNLGNIYFAQRDWDGAILEYDLVIQNHPRSAIAFYNKSLAHAENFQFREREEAFARAGSLDDAAVASYERRTGERRAVADIRLGPDEILAKFYGLEQDQHAAPVSPSWIEAFGGAGSRFAVVPVLLGGVLVVLERSLRRHGAQSCLKCGRAFCRRCQIGKDHRGLCTQCYHLFFVRNGVSAAARNDKMLEVRKAGKTRGLVFRVLSLVAPGAGHVAEDMPLFGMPLLVLWVCGWVPIMWGSRLYPLPKNVPVLGTSFVLYVAIGLLLALILVVANTIAQPRLRR